MYLPLIWQKLTQCSWITKWLRLRQFNCGHVLRINKMSVYLTRSLHNSSQLMSLCGSDPNVKQWSVCIQARNKSLHDCEQDDWNNLTTSHFSVRLYTCIAPYQSNTYSMSLLHRSMHWGLKSLQVNIHIKFYQLVSVMHNTATYSIKSLSLAWHVTLQIQCPVLFPTYLGLDFKKCNISNKY